MNERQLIDGQDCVYLGDGAYLTFRDDGMIFWTNRHEENGLNWVALSPTEIFALKAFMKERGLL